MKKITNIYAYTSLLKVIGLVIGFNISACDCRQAGTDTTKQDGGLVMSISNTKLIGATKTIEAVFKLSDDSKGALLDNFKLKVSFLKQEGGSGSTIKYNAYADGKNILTKTKTTLVEERLIRFTRDKELSPGDDPLKVAFSVRPGKCVTSLVASFTLLDAANQPIDDNIEVNWEEEKQPINIVLERVSAEHIKGANRTIQLKISNYGTQQLDVNELKLKAVRTIGTSAIIDGSVLTTDMNEYEMTLGEPMNNKSIIQNLTIIPNKDVIAEYTLQLLYKGELIGNKVKAYWKKGIELTLSDIEYDKTTQSIIYTVANTGSVAASNLKIQYTSKTAGIKLDGDELEIDKPRIKSLNNLNPGAILKNQVLGKLNFSKNKSADFEFKATCEEGFSTIQHHTINAEDIDLYIDKLIYDQANGLIIYNVKNRGTCRTMQKIKLQYSNVSEEDNLEGKTVLIENSNSATIDLGEISKNNGETGDRKLAIDFKYADEASFKFELVYNGNILTHETRIENFKAKPVQLKLIPVTPLKLMGPEKTIKYKIESIEGSRPSANIDASKLELIATNELGNVAYLTQTLGGAAIAKLAGDILKNNLDKESELYINANRAKEATFSLVLKYKNTFIPQPIRITWEEAILKIVEVTELINDCISTFKLENLRSTESIPTGSISIQLLSSNKAEFVLLTPDNSEASTSANLDHLTNSNLLVSSKLSEPIRLKLANSNGEAQATITIIAKHGNVEVAKQEILWSNLEMNINLKVNNRYFNQLDVNEITLINSGPTISTDKIKIKLTNKQGITFKLGNWRGDKITIDLKEILGKDKLVKDKTQKFYIQIEGLNEQYCAELILKVLDVNNNLINGDRLVWTNDNKLYTDLGITIIDKLNQEFEILKRRSDTIKSNFQEAKKEKKEINTAIWYDYIEQIMNNQKELNTAIENTRNKFNNMCAQKVLIDEISSSIERIYLSDFNKQYTERTKYIAQSLDYVNQQIEESVSAIEKSQQDTSENSGVIGNVRKQAIKEEKEGNEALIDLWLGILIKLSNEEAKDSLVCKALEKAQNISSLAKEIVTTPIKNQEALRKLNAQRVPKNKLAYRSLTDEFNATIRTVFNWRRNDKNN